MVPFCDVETVSSLVIAIFNIRLKINTSATELKGAESVQSLAITATYTVSLTLSLERDCRSGLPVCSTEPGGAALSHAKLGGHNR